MEHPIVITSRRTIEETSEQQLSFNFNNDGSIQISWKLTVPYPINYIRLDTSIK